MTDRGLWIKKFPLRPPTLAPRSPDLRLWTFNLGLVLSWSGFVYAQDNVPVLPLEAGALLTFHPICVHFAIALSVFGLILDWAGSLRQQASWQQAGRLSFFVGVVAMGLAVLSGWMEQQLPQPASAFDSSIESMLFYHEYLGYSLLGFFVALAVARLQIPSRLPALFMILSGLGLAGLIVEGYLGGELVYRYGAGVRAVQILSQERTDSRQKKAPAEETGAVDIGE